MRRTQTQTTPRRVRLGLLRNARLIALIPAIVHAFRDGRSADCVDSPNRGTAASMKVRRCSMTAARNGDAARRGIRSTSLVSASHRVTRIARFWTRAGWVVARRQSQKREASQQIPQQNSLLLNRSACAQMRSHDFSTFMSFPGCKRGKHTQEKPPPLFKSSPAPSAAPVRAAIVHWQWRLSFCHPIRHCSCRGR